MTVEFHALDKCKRHDFEDTCQAIQDALDKSEISLPEEEKLHADDDN